jgi:hypothetical protein
MHALVLGVSKLGVGSVIPFRNAKVYITRDVGIF